MSRVGKLPVQIPNGVTVKVDKQTVTVEGPKGKLSQPFRREVTIAVEDTAALVSRIDDSKKARAMHGLYRNLLNNMVIGVSQGFRKTLVINGVGYRAEIRDKNLFLNLGYSNPIEYPIPEGMQITVEGTNKVVIGGIDKQQVGQVASEIRGLRPPEPYKGKGVKYEEEQIRRKVGKSGIK